MEGHRLTWTLEVFKPTGRKLPSGADIFDWREVPGALAPGADGWLVLELVERMARQHGGARATSSFATITVRSSGRSVEVWS